MKALLALALFLPFLPPCDPAEEVQEIDWKKQLAPVAGLAGQHRGTGRSKMGGYQERWNGEWINGGTALMLRTESRMGRMPVFQDVRVFTWDPKARKIRARQFANGGVCTYDVAVEDGGKKLVLHQRALEGIERGEWRYTISLGQSEKKNQVHYRLDQKNADGEFSRYVMGKLAAHDE